MKILITGGSGFIGQKLCMTLVDHGHKLTLLSRRPSAVAKRYGQGVEIVQNLLDLDSDRHFEAVINLSGESIAKSRWTTKRKQILRDSRLGVTEQLIEFIRRSNKKPRVLVSGSAIGYYGNQGDKIIDENSDYHNDFGHQLCADWEQTAMQAAGLGLRVCILRTGLVIGRGGGFLKPMVLPFKMGLGGRLGDGKQWMSWVHRNDLVAMIEHLMNTPHSHGVYNGTAPNPVTNDEFSQCLASVFDRKARLPLPAPLIKLLLGEMSTLLLDGQRVLPKRFQGENFRFEFTELKPALIEALR